MNLCVDPILIKPNVDVNTGIVRSATRRSERQNASQLVVAVETRANVAGARRGGRSDDAAGANVITENAVCVNIGGITSCSKNNGRIDNTKAWLNRSVCCGRCGS